MVFFSVGNVLIWPRMPFTYQKSLANWNLFYDCSQAWSGFLGFNFDHQITNKDYLEFGGINQVNLILTKQNSCPVFRISHVSFFFNFLENECGLVTTRLKMLIFKGFENCVWSEIFYSNNFAKWNKCPNSRLTLGMIFCCLFLNLMTVKLLNDFYWN